MIEPILFRPFDDSQLENMLATMRKLNEVIEAVNYIRPMVDPLERMQKNAAMLGKVPVPEAEPPEQVILPIGNCAYCDTQRGSSTGWGMSPEGWAQMLEEHNKGHPAFRKQQMAAAQPGKGV